MGHSEHTRTERFEVRHRVAIALQVLQGTYFSKKLPEDNANETVMREGVIIGSDAGQLAKQFISAIAQHRFWEREKPRKIPA